METVLKKWRADADLSSESAAAAVGVTAAMWSRWETGRRRVPAERVGKISGVTGIPPEILRPDLATLFGPAPSKTGEATV